MAYARICLHGGRPGYISDLMAYDEGDVPSQREWTNVHSLHVEMNLHIEMVWQVRTAILFYSHKKDFLEFSSLETDFALQARGQSCEQSMTNYN